MYAISAQLEHKTNHWWTGNVEIPTFYLNERVQGIVSEDHARQIAEDILMIHRSSDCVAHITAVKLPIPSLGKADWIWSNDLECHIPACIVQTRGPHEWERCGNGPLVGTQIDSGNCGEHG